MVLPRRNVASAGARAGRAVERWKFKRRMLFVLANNDVRAESTARRRFAPSPASGTPRPPVRIPPGCGGSVTRFERGTARSKVSTSSRARGPLVPEMRTVDARSLRKKRV